MPSPLLMHRIKMPQDKPTKCDDCPLFGSLPKEMTKKHSKYIRICLLTSEYLSNRAGHLKVGSYCPMRPQSPKLTARTLQYASEDAKALINYTPGYIIEIAKATAEYFGIVHDPIQGELNLK